MSTERDRRQQIVADGGVCPCGVRLPTPSRAIRRQAAKSRLLLEYTVTHATGCPGGEHLVIEAGSRYRKHPNKETEAS